MVQNMENIDFVHIFRCNFATMASTEATATVIFEFFGTFLTRSIGHFVQSCFIFLEKMHKAFENSGPGVQYRFAYL